MMKLIPSKIFNIFNNLLPMVILFTVVISIIRITSLVYAKEKIIIYKELKTLVAIIYIFSLFYLVTTTDFESYSNNFIPFKEMTRYHFSSKLFFRNVIGNIVLFVPFGYLVTDMIIEKAKKCHFLIPISITFITSLIIEFIQMNIGRSFDVDDIILNFIGGIFGYVIFVIIHALFKHIKNEKKLNLIKALLICGLMLGVCLLFYVIGVYY
ncbi:MAG: VanZ family protein [Bacilli bacterium]|nr:VanZ family protein [Bacilli bacterium]